MRIFCKLGWDPQKEKVYLIDFAPEVVDENDGVLAFSQSVKLLNSALTCPPKHFPDGPAELPRN